MTQYIVHIYREMRLTFADIEADTPEAAAALARDKTTDQSDNIEDCDGDDLSALVDLAGDEDYSQSVAVDFEAERQRNAAPALLAVLTCLLDHFGDAASEEEIRLFDKARTAITEAKASGVTPAPDELDTHALLAKRREIAVVWCVEDVQEVRPDLDDDQAWEVLQHVRRRHDATIGINWDVLDCHADMLYGYAPKTAAAEEA
jgi:hypothetical protein